MSFYRRQLTSYMILSPLNLIFHIVNPVSLIVMSQYVQYLPLQENEITY